ncbi:conserved hypothetical membrane protein [Formosa agariphila KMM 3901]|uniref:Conserved hypothetical membrane protein n=1 Tax=Formosa agariphila (strain DSM 15362 / KCTC 12365 / LMG 23005 / KMM 3901 / M-2Alg 35-1) TaxID=1347342 RepID=T2KML0_FORAG|nr:hypothetical protein [Formosa agariphila]CDF80132.1 conserved hypothetical membrane protein [Formosa agariphila KMM 3901]
MQEFFKNYYWILTFIVEGTAAVTALICYKKFKFTPVKFFIYFLIYVFVCEFIALYPRLISNGILSFLKGTILEPGFWWTTLFWCIGSPVFYMFFYQKIIESVRVKKIIKVLNVVFIAFSVLTIALNFNDFFEMYFSSILIFGEFIILFLVGVYLYEMLQSDKIIYFNRSMYFYISACMLIWLLITTPLVFYGMYFNTSDWNFVILYWQVFFLSNFFMYLTFTFALLWCTPEKH